MFKPGQIRKVEVENFVTYSYAELYPGPNLNMLIGPNGTGKSTIVAAIILGLGGNPKTIGRGTKVSEYVKHDCNLARINIFLEAQNARECLKVTREFTVDDKTTWKINDKKLSLKEMLEHIKPFNIQVDNLCQFLPQDRVQDFAKMNKQDLLKQTQVAVCRTDLLEKQTQLIDSRQRHNDLITKLNTCNQKLTDAVDANLRLQGKVKNFRKKKQYLERIRHIDRKIAWKIHSDLKDELQEVGRRRDQIKKDYLVRKEAVKPLENALNGARRSVQALQGKITEIGRNIKSAVGDIEKQQETYSNLKQNIDHTINEQNAKLRDIEKQMNEIKEQQTKIQQLTDERTGLMQDHPSEEMFAEKLQNYNDQLGQLNASLRKTEDKVSRLKDTRQNKVGELRYHENQLSRIEDVKNQRMELLSRVDRDAYKGVLWLAENRHLFESTVYEPMILEINVLNPQHAVYFENIIPFRDRVAFTCTSKNDMNIIINELRGKQKLSVNVLYSPPDDVVHYRSAMPIEQITSYGFYAYLDSLFTAPAPIMNYLCKMYRLQDLPVGNEVTDTCFMDVPRSISVFFSHTQRYSVMFSKYTGEKTVRNVTIRADRTLALTMDPVQLETFRDQVNDCRNDIQRIDGEIQGHNSAVNGIREQIAVVNNKKQSINEIKRRVENITNKMRMAQNRLQQMQLNVTSREDIEQETKAKQKEIVTKMVRCQESIRNHYKIYIRLLEKHKLENLNMAVAHKDIEFLNARYQEMQESCRQFEESLQEAKRSLEDVRRRERLALEAAKDLSDSYTPDDQGFAKFRQVFDELPNDIHQLESEKDDVISRVECMTTADDNELIEFETRERLIAELRANVTKTENELEQLNDLLDHAQEQWLTPLSELVEEINVRFGAAFERMGCVGEVSICKGDDEKDYSQYGLSIKVSYRDGEPVQELNTTVQSGGERAVATAAFMLSLQELTPVPFRCVDEINQGMDVNNERRVFELLVESTSRPDTAQYFLITPKLVPNLKFVRNMKIHIVHNGPFLSPPETWQTTRLCNPNN